jgi:hypothetical protein
VHRIAAELNDVVDDPLVTTAKVGAALAVDLLEDGSVRDQPIYRGLLLRTRPPNETS